MSYRLVWPSYELNKTRAATGASRRWRQRRKSGAFGVGQNSRLSSYTGHKLNAKYCGALVRANVCVVHLALRQFAEVGNGSLPQQIQPVAVNLIARSLALFYMRKSCSNDSSNPAT